MEASRRVEQPGPEAPERLESAVGRLVRLDFTLEPGLTLNAAVAGPLLRAGLAGAQVEISGGALSPFTYVMPAAAPDATHAAWYSAPFAPAGAARVVRGNVTFGHKGGAPFIHCHADWITADGRRGVGHVMPHETVVAAPIHASAYGTADVALTADFDPETNFTLFTPHALAAPRGEGARLALARVRPNVDLAAALAALCRRHGFAGGILRGGVGSLAGARFDPLAPGGVLPQVTDYATEVFVGAGSVAAAGGTLAAALDITLVGMSGIIAEGPLARGGNPVLITFELAVEESG
ncbi:DUF296 domain-containing protein [Xanthobacter sp. AM11]|uniref:DUF296 domain-containing protein n=1 Tax=Xanthobacter sp. AM11 TaxID=3380643 RepID=UPI0039BFF531